MRRGTAALGALLLVAACNSTTRQGVDAAATIPRGDDAPLVDGRSASASAAGTPRTDAVDGAPIPSTGVPAPGSDPATTRATAPGAASDPIGDAAPDAAEVVVGIHLGDNRSAAGQFGVAELPDIEPQDVQHLVDWVNANGGLGGRPIRALYHRSDPMIGSFDAQAQQACAALVEDGGAQVVISNALTPSTTLLECLAGHGVALVWELHMALLTRSTTQRYGDLLYRPSQIDGDRLGAVIDRFAATGFLTPERRVGILHYDTPDDRFVAEQVFAPALARNGIAVTEAIGLRRPDSAGAAGELAVAAGNAVLRFRNAGVDVVLFVPTGGAVPLLFLPAAASQGYRPAYALTSLDAPDFLRTNFGPEQLRTSRVVGWLPDLDIPDERDDRPRSGAYGLCRDIVDEVGLAYNAFLLPHCEALFFLQRTTSGTGDVSPAGLGSAVSALGAGFDSPRTFGTRFDRSQHDGASIARDLAYDEACQCFAYDGQPFGVP